MLEAVLAPLLLDGKGAAVQVAEMVLGSLGWDVEQQVLAEVYFKQVPPTYSQQMIEELKERWIAYVTGSHQPNDNDDDICEF
uniref:Uncharacterized protein n=1 Tax=Chenopodium quinoa TaxID=63459 RepID=A0A803MT54_CHEQI